MTRIASAVSHNAGRGVRQDRLTLAWIAERLQMGAKTHLAHLLYWQRRDGK